MWRAGRAVRTGADAWTILDILFFLCYELVRLEGRWQLPLERREAKTVQNRDGFVVNFVLRGDDGRTHDHGHVLLSDLCSELRESPAARSRVLKHFSD